MFYLEKMFSTKKEKKYSEQLEDNLSFPNFRLSRREYVLQKCPRCGYEIRIKENDGICTLELENDNFGDIIYDSLDPKYSLVMSGKMLESLQPIISGIRSINKVEQVYIRKQLLVKPPLYYMVELERSTLTMSRKNSILKNSYRNRSTKCSICNPDKKKYLTIEKLVFDYEENQYDIFTLYEDNSLVIINEYFLNLCKSNGLTNVIERAIPIENYQRDLIMHY